MGRNRIEAVVGALLGAGGLLLVGYLGVSGLPGRAPTPVATEAVVGLWDAYGQARVAAQEEAGDARLVSATTQWQGVGEEALLAGAGDWSFVFYSPASRHVLDVVVSGTGAALVNRTRVWNSPAELAEGRWREGPRDALLIFMAYGGDEFLEQHPAAVASLHLAAGEVEGADGPAWSVAAVDMGDQSAFALVVDASTGQVLSVHPDEGG
jgi:hypothetical protein